MLRNFLTIFLLRDERSLLWFIFIFTAVQLLKYVLSCSLQLSLSSVLFYDIYLLLDAELGSLLLEITLLITASPGKAAPRALPQVKENAHRDLADGPVLSHIPSLQRVFPDARMVFLDWRLPNMVPGERREWAKPVAELLPPTPSSCGTHRSKSFSP